MSSPPDPLDSLLSCWRAAEPPKAASDSLNQEVWRRIADAEIATDEVSWRNRLEGVFSRPSFAGVFVAACALFGLFLAEVRVSRIQAQRNVQLAQAYIQLIDPLLENSTAIVSAADRRLSQ